MHALSTCFLALYLAHLVTDFILQSDRMVTQKKRGSPLAYAEHGGIHLLAAILFLGFALPGLWTRPSFYAFTIALTLTHLVMDWAKLRLIASGHIDDSATSFLTDQALHLLTVFATAWLLLALPFRTSSPPYVRFNSKSKSRFSCSSFTPA